MEVIASRRRTLFAAASAIVLGGGVTAGTAASVADYAETSDAELGVTSPFAQNCTLTAIAGRERGRHLSIDLYPLRPSNCDTIDDGAAVRRGSRMY